MLNRLKIFLRALMRGDRIEQELDEELRYDLEREIERNVASGMDPEEARGAALRGFGNIDLFKEESRDARGLRWVEDLVRNARFGARTLIKNPGFTLVVVLTLALGIGANTAIFSVVHAVLLRPLPYEDPERLVAVWGRDDNAKDDHTYLSWDDFKDYGKSTRSLDLLSGVTPSWSFTLTGPGDAERVRGFWASATFLPALGLQPALGRWFDIEEDKPGGAMVALVSHGFWLRRFGGDREIVGRPLTLDGDKVTVVGVLPAGFRWLEEVEIWRPLAQNAVVRRGRAVRILSFLGRLKAGFTQTQAQAELDTIAARLAGQYPESNTGIGARAIALHEDVTGKVRPGLMALMGAVILVLLIACANVANLLLARARDRAREIAVRSSLGASRPRLVAQLLVESVLLAAFAGAIGLVFALWGVDLLVNLSPVEIPRRDEIGLDRTVLSFTALLALLSGIVFGLVPALHATRGDLTEALKEGNRGMEGPTRRSARSVFVVAEVAFSIVVVAASGLFVRSFARLQGVDPGFDPRSVLSFDLPLTSRYQDAAARIAFYQRFYDRLEALPGVTSAGDVTRLPLAGRAGNPTTMLAIEGVPKPPGERPQVDFRRAGRNYFRAMGISLAGGRLFDQRDTPDSESVALINETARRRYFPSENPLGRRIGFGNDATPDWYRVVGIVGDVRHVGLQTEPRPEVYIAASQAPPVAPVVVARTNGDPAALVSAVRSVVRELDPDIPVFNVLTLEQIRSQSLAQPRFQVSLFGLFGSIALLLAVIGVYGMMAYSVSQRTHEVGIRMALGADRKDVLRLVVGEGMRLAAIGILIGIPAALAATKMLGELLFEVTTTDVPTFAAVALLLAAAAFAACLIPARRASRVDPIVALRYE